MPKKHKNRSRSKNRKQRSRSRVSHSRDRGTLTRHRGSRVENRGSYARDNSSSSGSHCSPPRERISRSKNRKSRFNYSRTQCSSPINVLTEKMNVILDRLTSLEDSQCTSSKRRHEPSPGTPPQPRAAEPAADHRESTAERQSVADHRRESGPPSSAGHSASAATGGDVTTTDRIVDAIRLINTSAQSTGKLDSGMRGPYRVVKTLPQGRYELELLAGSYGKTTQAAAEFMVPWRGEWTPEACAAFFESADLDDAESTSEPAIPTSEPVPSTSSEAATLPFEKKELENDLQAGRPS